MAWTSPRSSPVTTLSAFSFTPKNPRRTACSSTATSPHSPIHCGSMPHPTSPPAAMFDIIPAIDLYGGKCVRLTQGDYQQQSVYGDDPPSIAEHWVSLGAPRIHTVDLEAAAAGRPKQLETIGRIVKRVDVPVQLGGGMRTRDDVRAAFDIGVRSVILGTALITD